MEPANLTTLLKDQTQYREIVMLMLTANAADAKHEHTVVTTA